MLQIQTFRETGVEMGKTCYRNVIKSFQRFISSQIYSTTQYHTLQYIIQLSSTIQCRSNGIQTTVTVHFLSVHLCPLFIRAQTNIYIDLLHLLTTLFTDTDTKFDMPGGLFFKKDNIVESTILYSDQNSISRFVNLILLTAI